MRARWVVSRCRATRWVPYHAPMRHLTRDEERARILREFADAGMPEIMAVLERQFAVLHNRAQVLLGLCGVIVSTTGFSGRLIAGTNVYAQWLVIAGVGFVLLAAAVVCWGVLHLRWLTMQLGADTAEWLATTLRYRDTKTNAYRVGLLLMLLGLALYAAAIAIMLLNPHAGALPAR
jgi:hypothetical protein